MSIAIIAGIDEAGRGALAGPVVAAACIFDERQFCPKKDVPSVQDSKELTPGEREEAYVYLTERCAFGIGMSDAAFIDAKGILAATERAMQMAVEELCVKEQPTYLLIDGRDAFWFDIPHSSVIRGDQTEPCISAASIIAKVTRDRLMVGYHEEHPEYDFGLHKGYGTEKHRENLLRFGPCPLHRKTFLRTLEDVHEPQGAFSG